MANQIESSQVVDQEASAQQSKGPGLSGQEIVAQAQPALADWAEIGQHFWVLGESLTTALRDAWQREENQQQLHQWQTRLQEAAEQVGQIAKEVVESPEFQQARLEVDKATQPAQAAGQRAFHDIQPHLLTALRQLRGEVDKLISRLEQQEG